MYIKTRNLSIILFLGTCVFVIGYSIRQIGGFREFFRLLFDGCEGGGG